MRSEEPVERDWRYWTGRTCEKRSLLRPKGLYLFKKYLRVPATPGPWVTLVSRTEQLLPPGGFAPVSR